MPQIIVGPQQHAPQIDGSVRGKAYSFLAKLAENDALPGLHVEPINHAVDPRVRTGRVDQFWRAVMFKVQGQGQDALYVYLGVWPHDDAIAFATRARLQVNPVNGIAELLLADAEAPAPSFQGDSASPVAADAPSEPLFQRLGLPSGVLVDELGLDPELVELAMEARTEEEILTLAELALDWQGVALIDLSAGRSVDAVRESLGIGEEPELEEPAADDDTVLAKALQHPAARLQFAFIEDNEELRRAIEDSDFAAWRVFLHPEQRRYAERSWGGSFRLSGGAGTGKTVVLLHRARALAKRKPSARILLTTFNKTLADALQGDLKILDPSLPLADKLGDSGILIRGVDAAVRTVLQINPQAVPDAVDRVLGARTSEIGTITDRNAWRDAIASGGATLPAHVTSPAFFQAEYAMVVLPQRVTTFEQYARVRRPGRGVALDRTGRAAVWAVITAYRLNAGVRGSIDFAEAAAIAAEILNASGVRPFDHVLVDEGQDLGPTQWQFLRSLVAEGPNDLFIAEDSHQRIYGHRVVLGRYGIKIVGRSQRLRLNYRTTAQNLRYAVSVLAGTDFVDLEEQAENSTDYRSARIGPTPRFIEAASVGEELDRAAEVVAQWLAEDASPESIGILVRTEQTGQQVTRALEERRISARFVRDRSVPTGKPVVMTMHRAKGMEFSKVLLFGLDASALPAPFALKNLNDADREDAMQREKSLLYVASTRARDELVIVWAGKPSELLPALP